MKSNSRKNFLIDFIEDLQSKGQYWFTYQDLPLHLRSKKQALSKAVNRLMHKNKISRLYRDFYIIIPAEYKKINTLPPTWFIEPFMKFSERSYYVGLLSAAALYGSAHQKIQKFQVLVDKSFRSISKGKLKIKFINNKYLKKIPVNKIKTETGFINVSTVEATALDLVQNMRLCGSLGNIATVIAELSEKLDENKLISTAKLGHYELPTIQRIGFILDCLGKEKLGLKLLSWVRKRNPRFIRLRPNVNSEYSEKNEKWRIFQNDVIEVDI